MRIHTSTVGNGGESRENESWKVRMKTGLKLAISGGLRRFPGWRSVGGGRGEWPGSFGTSAVNRSGRRWWWREWFCSGE
ncbi:unnamed protein product [Prunus armeniaca]